MSVWSWNGYTRGTHASVSRLALTAGLLLFQAGCSLVSHDVSGMTLFPQQQPRSEIALNQEIAEGLVHATKLHDSGEFVAAHDVVRRLIQTDPYSIEARQLQADITFSLGQRTQSARALQAVAVLKPNSAELQHEVGMKLIRLDARQAGLRALTKATELAPHQVKYVHDLAGTHFANGNIQLAKAVLLVSHRRNPSDETLPIALARLFESQGSWDRAIHYYTIAVANDPENSAWLRQRGRAWYQLEKYEPARVDLAACFDHLVADEDWTTLLEYGNACFKTGETIAAQQVVGILETHHANSALLPQKLIALVGEPGEQQMTPAEIAPVSATPVQETIPIPSTPPVLATNPVPADTQEIRSQPRARLIRDMTLVRHVKDTKNNQQPSLFNGPLLQRDPNAEETPAEEAAKNPAVENRDDGWKSHRRAG